MSKEKEETQLQEQTVSERFVSMVERQWKAEIGQAVQMDDYKRTLAQHLFLHADRVLKELNQKRKTSHKELCWQNVNMNKTALDAVHRVNLGIDALQPNHVNVIPYYDSKLEQYNLDLRLGYEGKHYVHKTLALEPPEQIIYQLVHETDLFTPLMKNENREVESYEFEIKNPFNRGEIVGGFGYIVHKEKTKNKLVLVSREEIDKARKQAKTDDFWNREFEKMAYKTVVYRTLKHVPLDPRKVNYSSYAVVESQDQDMQVIEEKQREANKTHIDFGSDDIQDAEFSEVEEEEQEEPPPPSEEEAPPEEEPSKKPPYYR